MVEYASADAVRRGGGAGHKPRNKSTEGHAEGTSRSKKRNSVVDNETNEEGFPATTTTNSDPQKEKSTATGRRNDTSTKSKVNNGTRTWKSKSRPAPGAALALAKREQVAIVPSQGRRITFDD